MKDDVMNKYLNNILEEKFKCQFPPDNVHSHLMYVVAFNGVDLMRAYQAGRNNRE